MAIEQSLGGAEFSKDFLVGHGRQLGVEIGRFNALERMATRAYKTADFTGTPFRRAVLQPNLRGENE